MDTQAAGDLRGCCPRAVRIEPEGAWRCCHQAGGSAASEELSLHLSARLCPWKTCYLPHNHVGATAALAEKLGRLSAQPTPLAQPISTAMHWGVAHWSPGTILPHLENEHILKQLIKRYKS